LLVRLRGREPEACEAFVDAHYRGVYSFFLWLTHDPEASADLTQETFTGFWGSTSRLDPARAPDLKAWLYGIARNRWRKRCRSARAAGEREGLALECAIEIPDLAPGPEDALLASLQTAEVARAVGELPADYREALVLRVFQELSYAQISEALGIGEGLARWRVHQARVRLRAALTEAHAAQEGGRARVHLA
jgi:RNA polymerase sigma-70 factor (ECF subfamily)